MSRWHTTEFDFLPERAFSPRLGKFGPMTLEGGGKGGSSAPPPDPRLVEAQIRSLGMQDKAIEAVMANTQSLMPLQRQQLEFGLQSARTAYDQAQDDRDWMLSRRGMLSGLQDRQVSDANSFNTEERREELAQQANADVNKSIANAQAMQGRGLERRGINPLSGRALAAGQGLATANAALLADSANKVRAAARQEGYALTDRANNSLAGYPAMGMQATGAGAGYGASGLGLANSGLAGLNSGWGAMGGLAGSMGSNATGMYGAQGSFNLGNAKLAQSDSDPFGSMLGMAAGAAGTAFGGPLGGAALKAFGIK